MNQFNARSVRYYEEIRKIIELYEEDSVSTTDIWGFLRVLHILSLDLNSATQQTETWVKSLLVYTVNDSNAIGAADATWNALLQEIGRGMPEARSYRREDLPTELLQRHTALAGDEHRTLSALSDHSTLVLKGITPTVGEANLHLRRADLLDQILERLELAQVVVISGAAGSGKSSIAKDVIGILAPDFFTFCFRAEEFASPHLDETLRNNGIPVNAISLGAILAGQGRKALLVESVERLLERPTRDAFVDLLTLVENDKSWRLILTCRDYSTDLIHTAFLSRVSHSIITIPPLSDHELDEVEATYPALAQPLGDPKLREVLRTPYFLDKALQIQWSDERSLPQNECEFRNLFWRQIVGADHRVPAGMSPRRQETLLKIALRRAQALRAYVPCDDLAPEVLSNLQMDSLIVASEQGSTLLALAHDVLEDWSILIWIGQQYLAYDSSIRRFSEALGSHPAIRRSYRKWVSELVEQDSVAADTLFEAVIRPGDLNASFRDDTLVSLLRSDSSVEFLRRHSDQLFRNNKHLLKRIIHLLRVACVTTPTWLKKLDGTLSFDVPDGKAWPCVLQLINANLELFDQEDSPILVGLLEDWAKGVSWENPYPDGAESVAAIAYWLLSHLDEYMYSEQQTRILKIVAKIPAADNERFIAFLDGNGDYKTWVTESFRKLIFEGLEGNAAARDLPDVIVSGTKNHFLCSETELREELHYTADLDLETLFGLKHGSSFNFFPASAYHGPFLSLLRNHPRQGLNLIIDMMNTSADWYANPRVASQIEPPFQITLKFADGTTKIQQCNARLWNLYRGTSVGPYVLQSILMALEQWLMEVAEELQADLDQLLLQILRRSDSAALTAVVASVATAYPFISGETLLVLLRSRKCILLDQNRLVHEYGRPSNISALMPSLSKHKIFENERREADARPHRYQDLERAIINLQLGPLAPRVHEILDQHHADLQRIEAQDEEDRVWRLALHRMDLRQYTATEEIAETTGNTDGERTEEAQIYIRLELNEPDPDIKEMANRSAIKLQSLDFRNDILWWGVSVFRGEDLTRYDPDQWRQMLQNARTIRSSDSDNEKRDLAWNGPGYVAAVCVRDHWDEMSDDEKRWSVDLICSEVEREQDQWNTHARIQRFNLSADRGCAYVLPLLIAKSLDDTLTSRVRQALIIALTHAIDEVRLYLAGGIGRYLWDVDPKLVLRCVNTLATQATLVQKAVDSNWKKPYEERQNQDEIEAEVATVLRQRFFEPDAISDDAYQTMDLSSWFGAKANVQILAILGQAPTELVSVTAFEQLALTIVEWWDSEVDRRRKQQRRERNYEVETALTELLVQFLLRTTSSAALRIIGPIVNAIDTHPDKVHNILIELIRAEDRQPNTRQFWALWEKFAEGIRKAKWLSRVDDGPSGGTELIGAIFLNTWWKEDIHHWRSLEGYGHRIDEFLEAMPARSTVLEAYIRFLYHIGEQSLPRAFISIARQLEKGNLSQLTLKQNSIFMLEILLQRYVYGKPLELKRESDLREAVFSLLDFLIESGSSAAFRMRDDFVAPISIA